MVDVIITCQSRRKILYTIDLGFMLILGLQGVYLVAPKIASSYSNISGLYTDQESLPVCFMHTFSVLTHSQSFIPCLLDKIGSAFDEKNIPQQFRKTLLLLTNDDLQNQSLNMTRIC